MKEIKISFRLNEEENALLNQLSSREGIDISKYLRTIIRNKEKAFTLSPEEVVLLRNNFANLTRIGSNLNQIAFHMNSRVVSQNNILNSNEKDNLETTLNQLSQKLSETKNQIVKLVKEAE